MKRMTRNFWKKLLCLTLTAMLIVLALPVLAEETDTEEVQYQAYASVALKVRREPRKDSSGNGSMPRIVVPEAISTGTILDRVADTTAS